MFISAFLTASVEDEACGILLTAAYPSPPKQTNPQESGACQKAACDGEAPETRDLKEKSQVTEKVKTCKSQ